MIDSASFDPDPLLASESDALAGQHGQTIAGRIGSTRADALVVVRGSSRLASAIAALLAASGVGHVYQEPDRPLRSPDLQGLPDSPHDLYPTGSALDRRSSAQLFADHLRRFARSVRTHPPATHQYPDLVVLVAEGELPVTDTMDLLDFDVPHLLAVARDNSAVVGPLVLPGRSVCALCIWHRGIELNPELTHVPPRKAAGPAALPAVLVAAAASTAVGDTLRLLEGRRLPATVDGSIEWWADELAPRRRSWQRHPACRCRRGNAETGANG